MIETILSPISFIAALYFVFNLISWIACSFGDFICQESFPVISLGVLVVSETLRRWSKSKIRQKEFGWEKKFFLRLIPALILNLIFWIGAWGNPYAYTYLVLIPYISLNGFYLLFIIAKAIEDHKIQNETPLRIN